MLLRGNRATKIDAEALDAFHSHNLPPLAELEVTIKGEGRSGKSEKSFSNGACYVAAIAENTIIGTPLIMLKGF